MLKNQILLKTLSMYLIYFIYTYFAGYLIQALPSINDSLIMMILDCLFLILIVFVYRKNIQTSFKKIKKDYSIGKLIKVIFLGVIAIFVLNIVMGALTEALFPNMKLDQNTLAIQELASISMIYTIFKTMVFGIVAEELLFRESLSECIQNKATFIVISALIYTLMNFIFTTPASSNYLVEIAIYFIPALLFSYIYVKNNRNIIILMLTKLVYNLIPLIILIAGLV